MNAERVMPGEKLNDVYRPEAGGSVVMVVSDG
jgi:hypothetical protein